MSVLNPEQKSVGQVTADIIQKIEREKDHRAQYWLDCEVRSESH